MTIWTVKKEAAYRLKLQHPWVYRDELKKAPQLPFDGAPVELQSESGEVLARGYGNLNSKLAFRVLSFGTSSGDPATGPFVVFKLMKAWEHKKSLGFRGSFRLCFGEGDGLPGLVIDYYRLSESQRVQALAVQILTAGMDSIFRKSPQMLQILIEQAYEKGLTDLPWDRTAIIYRNDVRVRAHEGLRDEEARFVQTVKNVEWTEAPVQVNAWDWKETLELHCDLYQGQKTGLFLDQSFNIHSVLKYLETRDQKGSLKVLDICCYVGHWSAQFVNWGQKRNVEVSIDLLDISETALQFAARNAQGASSIKTLKLDALKDWPLEEQMYDVVICDPPAFVKSSKDLDKGLSAYVRLNSEALKRVKSGGLFVSCSCSGLVDREAFDKAIQKGFIRSQRSGHLLFRGGNAWDHTAIPHFPEGQYLKMNVYGVG